MTTLAKSKVRAYESGYNELPVIAADIIYQGAAVGDDGNGYAQPLSAGNPFRGFADDDADNAAGAAGDKTVKLKTEGKVQLAISGLGITDVGKDVFASDDDTFTLTQSTNTRIGFVYRYVSSGIGIVQFNANNGIVAEVAGTLTGTTDGTIADIAASAGACAGGSTPTAAQVDTAIATAVATIVTGTNLQLKELQTTLNALCRRLGN